MVIFMSNRVTSLGRQTGVVLVVSLVMLLLLTLIGITGTQVTSLEERMAGNARDQNIAFQAAESALLDAEQRVLAGAISYGTDVGFLALGAAEPDFFAAATWTAANSASTASFGANFVNNSGTAIADPRYIVQPVTPLAAVTTYKITTRAVGINPGTQVILQEYYEKTF